MTPKAEKEIAQLNVEISNLQNYINCVNEQRRGCTDNRTYNMFGREVNRMRDQQYKKEEKIRDIGNLGISTSEKNILLREAADSFSRFVTIKSDKTIGGTSYTKIGWSKMLQSFVKVGYYKYSSLMNSVQDCSSLANKSHLDNFERITELDVETLLKAGNEQTTSFCGTETKNIPISRTVESLKPTEQTA